MNLALCFDFRHDSLSSLYGIDVLEKVLSTRAIQSSNRHVRVCVGDLFSFAAPGMMQTVVQHPGSNRLRLDRFKLAFRTGQVYCWLIQNCTSDLADQLDSRLDREGSYLGALEVDYSNPAHLRLFRMTLIEKYRIHGCNASVFYEMGMHEEKDVVLEEIFRGNGINLEYEDAGARRTILDNYDTLAHFQRVADFERIVNLLPDIGSEEASDLSLRLEELHPKLFDSYAAGLRTLERAETAEDLAQVSLTGRRILEQVADYLFPPKSTQHKGRDVGQQNYKNRLWAYLVDAVEESESANLEDVDSIGGQIDALVDQFNKGLHSDLEYSEVSALYRDLIVMANDLLAVSPASARKPYLAYENRLADIQSE